MLELVFAYCIAKLRDAEDVASVVQFSDCAFVVFAMVNEVRHHLLFDSAHATPVYLISINWLVETVSNMLYEFIELQPHWMDKIITFIYWFDGIWQLLYLFWNNLFATIFSLANSLNNCLFIYNQNIQRSYTHQKKTRQVDELRQRVLLSYICVELFTMVTYSDEHFEQKLF